MNEMKQLEQMAVLEILCLPLYLYTYDILPAAFWILLILMDSYELKQLDLSSLLNQIETQEKTSKLGIILTIGYACGLGVVAFKNIALAGILIVNELLITLASFVNLKNKDEK